MVGWSASLCVGLSGVLNMVGSFETLYILSWELIEIQYLTGSLLKVLNLYSCPNDESVLMDRSAPLSSTAISSSGTSPCPT